MNNPFRRNKTERKRKSAADILEEIAERMESLEKENAELRFRCTSLELEVKRQMRQADTHKTQARTLAVRNTELKKELTTLKIRYDHEMKKKGVIGNASWVESSDCGA